ncbi:MAG: lytic murein transglycosylase [Mesorhizobium sp.]|nr:MAG: lytic murein transglycosylase [Mesorhizobium sp.]RWQ51163.1 MAG: lytic murein transglycosylase [Mesorhizobium sp.]
MNTPLRPAGHLPLKGEDWQPHRRHLPLNLENRVKAVTRVISPLEGETAGRPEGGASRLPLP